MLRPVRAIVLAAVVTLLVACGSSVTQENYDRIETGMTVDDVVGILGASTTSELKSVSIGDMKFEAGPVTWESGDATIVVTFAQGKVVTKMSEGL